MNIPDQLEELKTLLEFQFIDRQHDVLLNLQAQVVMNLKKEPFSPINLARRDAIANDLNIFNDLVFKAGTKLLRSIEQREGVTFRYLVAPVEPNPTMTDS